MYPLEHGRSIPIKLGGGGGVVGVGGTKKPIIQIISSPISKTNINSKSGHCLKVKINGELS